MLSESSIPCNIRSLLTVRQLDVYERFMVNKGGLKTELSNHMNHETITICT